MMHQWIALYISFLSIYGSAMETSPEKNLVHNIPTIRYTELSSVQILTDIYFPFIENRTSDQKAERLAVRPTGN